MGDAPSWSLRSATVDDAPDIARFHMACWIDAYRGIVPDGVLARVELSDRAARWRRRLVGGSRSAVVAELAAPPRRIVGIASWGPSHDPPEPGVPTLELASLYVDRGHWGSGLADSLVDHAIGGAPAQLWVFVENARARAFYAKHGFIPDGYEKTDEKTGVLECRYVRS